MKRLTAIATSLGRAISVQIRKFDSIKDRRRVLNRFGEWRRLQSELEPPRPAARRPELLVIRLDDIGDYLLFRNHLRSYKESTRWRAHRVTLLANQSWREIFDRLDADAVDDVVWVDKQRYLEDPSYGLSLWGQLRSRGVETVIAPSRTRPLLLDDLCMLAAAPQSSIGCANTNVHESWNELSDGLYGSLYTPPDPSVHESTFNRQFAEWVCERPSVEGGPRIQTSFEQAAVGRYVICFVGASIRSKRWPAERWIEFIGLLRETYPARIFLAGQGRAELDMVRSIQDRTGAESIAGTVTLSRMIDWVAGAQAIVTNDTMTAHMGVALMRPTVIIANGVNYLRFSEYRSTSVRHAATLYPDVVSRHRARRGDGPYAYSDAITADIASISAPRVLEELKALLALEPTANGVPSAPPGHAGASIPVGRTVPGLTAAQEPVQ